MRFSFPQRVALLSAMSLAMACGPAQGFSTTVADPTIHHDLVTGHAQDALNRISSTLAENPNNAEALELRCRVLLQEHQWSAAVDSCHAAVEQAPESSEAHFWLGRAYGEQAQRVKRLKAFALARKLHVEFEKVIELDPSNVSAYDALGEFYVEAPGIVGGGLKKARDLEAKLRPLSPARADALAAEIAEKEKKYPLAEQEWKAQIASSHHPEEAWMDLAGFYRRRDEMDPMVAAVQMGVNLDKDHTIALVDGARLLAATGLNLPEAAQWLREYLRSNHQSEEAPAFAVHAELAKLLLQMGKSPEAQQQLADARQLAPGYKPRS